MGTIILSKGSKYFQIEIPHYGKKPLPLIVSPMQRLLIVLGERKLFDDV